jgi:hypothetical protein
MPDQQNAERSERQTPSPQDVAKRAYELFEARGSAPGHDLENWLDAERELSATSQRRPKGRSDGGQGR